MRIYIIIFCQIHIITVCVYIYMYVCLSQKQQDFYFISLELNTAW